MDVEIVLLADPFSVNVADVVPEAPMVADAVATVPRTTAPVAVRAPLTVAPVEEERAIRLVALAMPMLVPVVPIRTPLMSTYIAVPEARETEPAEPVADKVRGPADVEMVLLDEPVSVIVADVVGPAAPMVVDAAAPVPRTTSPVAARAPFTVTAGPVEDERAIRLVALETPMLVPIALNWQPLMSTYAAAVGVVSEMVPAAFVMSAVASVRVSADEMDAPAASVTRPVTPSVPPSAVAPVPDTVSVLLSVVAPDTPSVPPSSVAPVPDTVSAPLVVAPDTPRVPATETPVEVSASKLVATEMPMVVPVALIRTPLMSTYLAEAVADSEMVELADDKVRGPVEVEMLLLTDPLSANVADVVVPEVPMVADAAAPVPRRTAPVAVKAPFTVALVEERAIRLVAPDTPMFVPEVPTRTPLMST